MHGKYCPPVLCHRASESLLVPGNWVPETSGANDERPLTFPTSTVLTYPVAYQQVLRYFHSPCFSCMSPSTSRISRIHAQIARTQLPRLITAGMCIGSPYECFLARSPNTRLCQLGNAVVLLTISVNLGFVTSPLVLSSLMANAVPHSCHRV